MLLELGVLFREQRKDQCCWVCDDQGGQWHKSKRRLGLVVLSV